MAQNTSHAVMQQRHEAHDSLDDFPTPPWATRALMEHVLLKCWFRKPIREQTCWEPAANRGYMVRPLSEYFAKVTGTDVHDYGAGFEQNDFLMTRAGCDQPLPDWIITNPPFRLAAQFASHALTQSSNVALLVRSAFLEGADRYKTLFRPDPPAFVAQFVERVPMVKGRHDPDASTATSYAWVVWMRPEASTRLVWIPPCRRQLQRADDV